MCIYPLLSLQETIATKDSMRNDPPASYSYLDRMFESQINLTIRQADLHFQNMMYREAMTTGFHGLQVITIGSIIFNNQSSC